MAALRFMESPLFLSDLLTGLEPRNRSAGLQTRLDDTYFETSRVGDRRSGSWEARGKVPS